MSDYSAVAPPPQQNFNQSSAFAAALQRAKQIAAKINPNATNPNENRQKRPLEDGHDSFGEPDAKKGPSNSGPPPQLPPPSARPPPSQAGMGGPAMGAPPMGGGPQINEDIKVPDKMVGLIIGRGGEQITRLQSESGCKIQMAPDSQGMPDRICSLSGTKDAINRAKELIMNIVHQRGRSEGLGGLDLGPNMGSHNNYPGMNNMNQPPMGGGGGPPGGGMGGGGGGGGGRNFVEIMIPGPKVGLIIGKGGETIKQLQEKSGAKMVVIQDGPNQEQEKPLRISGDPSKVEFAKQLVYDLIAEKEMQNYNRRGGGGRQQGRDDERQYNDYGGGGANEAEVLVPRQAVGVVIGKGGDMIKKIQAETGARVQFQQAREEGPGERRCYLSGTPKQVEQARQRIEELIDSVHRRDGEGPGQGRGGGRGRGGGGGDRYDNRGNNRNGGGGGGQEYGGWDDRRQQEQQPPQEVTFAVPASKCGVIIGRGGETIKQINLQSGAHCELDRRSQNNQNSNEKTFIIRGSQDQIEAAKRILSDKVQMPLNFVPVGGSPAMPNNMQTAYPGMAPQGYNPQNWGMPSYQQNWNAPQSGSEPPAQQNSVQVNPSTGQPDYSLQWAEYYRSLGMHREAEMIEQQAKTKGVAAPAPGQPQAASAAAPPTAVPTAAPAATANGGQPDYSVQWAEYYRSIGKIKDAEAIEAQMKSKSQPGVQQMQAPQGAAQSGPAQASQGGYQQQAYGAYQTPGGYYGGQTQSAVPSNVQQGAYGFPSYGYGGGAPNPPNNSEN